MVKGDPVQLDGTPRKADSELAQETVTLVGSPGLKDFWPINPRTGNANLLGAKAPLFLNTGVLALLYSPIYLGQSNLIKPQL